MRRRSVGGRPWHVTRDCAWTENAGVSGKCVRKLGNDLYTSIYENRQIGKRTSGSFGTSKELHLSMFSSLTHAFETT